MNLEGSLFKESEQSGGDKARLAVLRQVGIKRRY